VRKKFDETGNKKALGGQGKRPISIEKSSPQGMLTVSRHEKQKN